MKTALELLEKLKREKRILDFAVNSGRDNNKTVCYRPFTTISIRNSGAVYTCCPDFVKHNAIGSIKENSLKEIWFGEKAQTLRKKILSGDYSVCDLDSCQHRVNIDAAAMPEKTAMPKYIELAYDRECNLHCIMCRDKSCRNTEENTAFYNKNMFEQLKPLLPSTEVIDISRSGEALFSRHSRELIKQIASEYKHIKWNILTNGILFTSENCKALEIYGRINQVIMSLPAMDKSIYDKIMPDSDYNTVIKNIKDAAYEYNFNHTIKQVIINSVISGLNYKEIPALVNFAAENNLYIVITKVIFNDKILFSKDIETLSVWNKSHPEFANFKRILKHTALNYEKMHMHSLFKKIRESA